ncbi:uncharacterized protein GGS22DRAFT_196600 [Annulohypoxylon maeteangense]|uniref:uncharacterized protein n=1 Tax=Annulohypoxylon maeteangense TaxID=1927788 RepID=UPI0020075498|nr:uncharacterized protein GGS22DRAFT_196600 [Annulohypoxylon maeteangense]KAI0888725.1 hypothetical protein GGS22DRAFT_196600 [Annulohypoxylon maeteangense]
MQTKVIFDRTGSILGKIPVKRREPSPCQEVDSSNAGRSYRFPKGKRNSFYRKRRPDYLQDNYQEDSDTMPLLNQSRPWSMVESYLMTTQPMDVDNGQEENSGDRSFFPTPMVTFLVEQPQNLSCMICRENIKMTKTIAYDTPGILPCGHVACYECLDRWVKEHKNCPVCRTSMVHPGCKHDAMILPITYTEVTRIPKTIPMGGAIGQDCLDCREADLRLTAHMKFKENIEDLKNYRHGKEPFEKQLAQEVEESIRSSAHDYWSDLGYSSLAW